MARSSPPGLDSAINKASTPLAAHFDTERTIQLNGIGQWGDRR
ncbi:hypothetical protein HAALTHF_28770n [Vreelandella aquamarina]|nr:hypothetical protein HAALTHF_28770n [Halomonas axialensis]